jgi:hypothetical protein
MQINGRASSACAWITLCLLERIAGNVHAMKDIRSTYEYHCELCPF